MNKFLNKKCYLHVALKNDLPEGKKIYFQGTISLCHCRGHDCLIVHFCFDGFYEKDRGL